MKRILVLLITCLISFSSFAQITVTPTGNAANIASFLTGNGVTITNVTVTGASTAYGYFTALNTNLGMNGGMVLTTGIADSVAGQNANGYMGYCHGTLINDPDLGALEPASGA